VNRPMNPRNVDPVAPNGSPRRSSWLCRKLALTPLAALAFFLCGCFGRLGPASTVPSSAGNRRVGVTKMVVKDARRDRKLDVEVWYPAADEEPKTEPAIYEVRAAGATVARLRSPTGARRDAKPWRDGGPRPVVLMSHGAGSNRFANASFSEVLASHGYIVAAPDHEGHTTGDKIWGISDYDRAQSAYDRPIDLSRVLDALEADSKQGVGLFSRLVDGDRVAVAGHSFGGRTALALVGARFDLGRQRQECAVDDDDRRCRALSVFGPAASGDHYRYRDSRVGAAVLIAPAGFEFYREDGIAQIDAPVLVIGAQKDRTTPYAERHAPLVKALESRKFFLDLENAGHLTATDVCDIVESIGFLGKTFGGDDAKDGCGDGYMPTRQALDQVSGASLAFLDVVVNHVPGANERLAKALGAPTPGPRIAATRPNRPRAARKGKTTTGARAASAEQR
jgi:predicted dienelactone hydrolase